MWVAEYDASGLRILLIDETGNVFEETAPMSAKVVRSGNRNLQAASMASITSLTNPIDLDGDGSFSSIPTASNWSPYRIVNSSAIEYSEIWGLQCENTLPSDSLVLNNNGEIDYGVDQVAFNPYLYNARGEWRAKKSVAYLTGRGNVASESSPRLDGFYTDFTPYYQLSGSLWAINDANWTFASEVSQYSPYGAELENKDALDRYSAAQYGYQYTLPVAVGPNNRYREIGFDGGEDYNFSSSDNQHFSFEKEVNTNDQVSRVQSTSHTGTASIKVEASSKAVITKRLIPCEEEE